RPFFSLLDLHVPLTELILWYASHPLAGSGTSKAGRAADQRRRNPGFAEEIRRAAATKPARPFGSAGGALAIKQGGYAGSQLPSSLRNLHQLIEFPSDLHDAQVSARPGGWFGESGRWP